MSALPPKADMCGALADVRFVPIGDVVHRVRPRATLAAIGKAVRQAIGLRVEDLPLRLENIERALWAGPDVTA